MFTYGFYDSLNGDRKYNAEQLSSIFDGVIADGVFQNVGDFLAVVAGTGMQVLVKTGRAWFNHTWSLNDSVLPLAIDASDVIRTRIDAVVLEVDARIEARTNAIKIVKGVPNTNAVKPTLQNGGGLHQYPLAYVTVNAGATSITAANIELMVGREETPFVTCPLTTIPIDDLFNQWNGEFDAWFDNVKAQLSGNVVTNLQMQIDEKVAIADKATDADLLAGTPGKWVDASMAKRELSYGSIGTVRCAIYTESGEFTPPANAKNNKFTVLCQGGGGGAGSSSGGTLYGGGGGGAGGHTKIETLTITSFDAIPITIGAGGQITHDGGVTSFGTYVTANGGGKGSNGYDFVGASGGSGGSGGGGGCGRDGGGNGGNGNMYGGGGGGASPARPGGYGGTYGGGGAGGNNGSLDAYVNGGIGGTYGGAGKAGQEHAPAHGAPKNSPFYPLVVLQLVDKPNGGEGGKGSSYGGGGGGGYSSTGGEVSGGAGGGGGMFGNGGAGGLIMGGSYYQAAGGGGGGFNAAGGCPGNSNVGGGGGGVSIGDGFNEYEGGNGMGYGAGGGGNRPNGSSGIVIISWEV